MQLTVNERNAGVLASWHGSESVPRRRRDAAGPAAETAASWCAAREEYVESKIAALTIGYDDFLTNGAASRWRSSRKSSWRSGSCRGSASSRSPRASGKCWRRAHRRLHPSDVFHEAKRFLHDGRAVDVAIIDLDDFRPISYTSGNLMRDRISATSAPCSRPGEIA